MSSATRFIKLISRFSSVSPAPNLVKLPHHRLTQNSAHRYLSNYTRMQPYNNQTRKFSVDSSEVQPSAPLPPQLPPSLWRWILGLVVTIIVPSTSSTWGPLLQIKKDVDVAVETIEEIVQVLENVAEIVDKVAEEISDDLPEGGKMKKVVEIVEDAAEATARDARTVGDAIDKVCGLAIHNLAEMVVGLDDQVCSLPLKTHSQAQKYLVTIADQKLQEVEEKIENIIEGASVEATK